MRKGYYGKEPFDLRLTVLRFVFSFNQIFVLTLLGTLIFGGGYYAKNVLMRTEREYSATSTYKVDYTTPPVNSGDYFINEVTWNTLVQTEEFLAAVRQHMAGIKIQNEDGTPVEGFYASEEEIAEAISAKLPSDWNIPTTTVVTNDPIKSVWIALSVEKAMEEELAGYMDEIESIRVIDAANVAEEVVPDVRPFRAFVLSALLSFFFVTVVFLLKEIGEDGIWLPTTLNRRYGLKTLGTINSPELVENITYLFRDKENIGVFSVEGDVDVTEVIEQLQERVEKSWTAVDSPLLYPESVKELREKEGTLAVIRADKHAGKPLEYVLEYLEQQDCEITAVILWEANEWLIKAYYCFKSVDK